MFTYLAARQSVLALTGIAASIGDTDLDLSAWIPDGAHTAILTMEVTQTVLGGAAGYSFQIYKSVAQGYAVRLIGMSSEVDDQGSQAHVPLSTDRHVRYAVTHPGGALRLDINMWLLGYIE